MAEAGEAGAGPDGGAARIAAAVESLLGSAETTGRCGEAVVVTSGPTTSRSIPVRYIANRSSGKRATPLPPAAAAAGAEVVPDSGRSTFPSARRTTIKVETAREMLDAVEEAMPADCAHLGRRGRGLARLGAGAREDQEGKDKVRCCRSPRSGHLCDHRAAQSQAAQLVIGLPPETETSSPMPRQSSRARAATGSSPTMSRPRPGSWAATATGVHLVTADGVESWAAAVEGRGRRAAPSSGGSRRRCGRLESMFPVDCRQLHTPSPPG